MNDNKVKELIDIGREFMKHRDDFMDHKIEGGFVSDQEKKLPQPPLVKANMRNESIKLPTDFNTLKIEKDFNTIINTRKSSRVFTKESMTLLELSYLLWVTQGVKEIRGKSYATIRTVPSGGARHAFETYLIVCNVEGLKEGKYHYLPMKHELEYLGEVENKNEVISESLCGQSWANKAAVIFYWSCMAYRAEWRYGIYAHRVALIDAGHVGQNLYIGCSALSLGTCAIAAFNDEVCNEVFELDGVEEFMVYSAPVGKISANDKEKEDAFYAFLKEEGL